MAAFLVLLAVICWAVGGLLLTPATYGVGALIAACLFAILARIAQAGDQHAELMRSVNPPREQRRH